MNQSDFGEFAKAMDLACGMLSKKMFDESVLVGYFNLFLQYPLQDIKASLSALVTSSDSQYGIRPDLVIKYMGIKEAKPETVEGILAKAKAKNSPLGIVASRHIKKWDFDNCSPFELRQKAAELIELLPNIEKDIQANGYSDHTLRLMVQYEVDPTGDFRDGVSGPEDPEQTRLQYKNLMIEDRQKEDSKKRRELQMQVSEAEEEAHAHNDHLKDRAERPELWAEIDRLRGEGKHGEALRLLASDAFSGIPADKPEMTGKQASKMTGIDL